MIKEQATSTIQANLTGKIALVTGASQGLGAYYAEVLAKNGASVIVSGRASSKARLDAVTQKINNFGGNAISFVLDVSDINSFNKKVEEIYEKTGKIDILINNAAVSVDKNIFDITPQDWDFHMDVNLKGLFFLSQAIAKRMKNQATGGNIINISAINGEKVRKNCISFGTSKAGVIHLTKSMAYELIDYKIRVNAILLGLFPSELVKNFLDNDPAAQDYLDRIPAKRAGKLSELDGPILLLASEASGYMYGTILNVDGGFSTDVFMSIDVKNS